MGNFASWSGLMHMGGYAAYVWPTYGFVILVLGVNLLISFSKLKKIIKQLRSHYANDS